MNFEIWYSLLKGCLNNIITNIFLSKIKCSLYMIIFFHSVFTMTAWRVPQPSPSTCVIYAVREVIGEECKHCICWRFNVLQCCCKNSLLVDLYSIFTSLKAYIPDMLKYTANLLYFKAAVPLIYKCILLSSTQASLHRLDYLEETFSQFCLPWWYDCDSVIF